MSGAALLLLAAATASPPAVFERALEATGSGPVGIQLDAPVYESARLDLGDLRVLDELGREVPFLLRRYASPPAPPPWQPPLLNRSDEPGRSTRASLDLGLRTPKRALELDLSGDNFRRRVMVEASDDAENWRTLTDSAWVFAVPGPPAARFESVRFPVNDQRHLRVTVFRGEHESGPFRLEAARVIAAPARERRERWIEPRATRAEVAAERVSELVLELGARHQPFSGIQLEVADPRFFRRVSVEARRDPLPDPQRPQRLLWVPLGEGALHRQRDADGDLVDEELRLDVSGRARVLRLVVHNRDDAPLTITGVRVAVPEERLVFEASAGHRYRLRYGDPKLAAPTWDLERSIADVEAWTGRAATAVLEAPQSVPAGEPRPLPWSERHPRLLLGVLLLVVAGLGLLTWRALATT